MYLLYIIIPSKTFILQGFTTFKSHLLDLKYCKNELKNSQKWTIFKNKNRIFITKENENKKKNNEFFYHVPSKPLSQPLSASYNYCFIFFDKNLQKQPQARYFSDELGCRVQEFYESFYIFNLTKLVILFIIIQRLFRKEVQAIWL